MSSRRIAEGARVYVHTPKFPGVSFATVVCHLGVSPEGLDVYRLRPDGTGDGVWLQVASSSLTDLSALAPRPRARFSPTAGHA